MESPNRLYSPRLSECYPLVPVLTKDRVELLFDDDDTEKKSDQLVAKLKENFSSFNLKSAADDKVRLRLIQSVVEVSGTVETCIDAHASWIARLINQSTSDNPEFLDLIAQLLYPYFTLHLTNETVAKHRNICIILASLATVMEADLKARVNLYQQVVTYLTQIVIKCHDPVILLFAIICLGNMNLHEIDKQEIHTNCPLMNKLNDIQSVALPLSSSSFSIQQDSYLGQQINFIVEWFIFTVLQATTVNDPSQVTLSSSGTKLDQSNKSEHLKLSVNLLTARSDGLWQSVKSIFCIKPVVYYEVTLHTSGPMRIGWTTNQSDIRHNLLGSDEYSIGFDGHHRVIWHENKQYRVKGIGQWRAGDTVGCFIGQGYFVFQLNGREIATPQLVYFSSRPYFAAASLSTFQQCSFNFTKTKHPPKRRNFMHFDSIRKARNAYIKARKHGQIYNSIVLYGSKMLSGDIKMIQQCPSCDNNNSTTEQDQAALLTNANIIEEEHEENTQQQQFDEDDESSN